MNWFDRLRGGTHCPFAKRASVLMGPTWQEKDSYEANVLRHSDALSSFGQRVAPERLHGIVFVVDEFQKALNFEEVRVGFCKYLNALAKFDKSCAKAMEADFLSSDWQFEHNGVRYFLNVFASFYGPNHSKFCSLECGFAIFLQPEVSFDFCGNVDLSSFKHEIRKRFSDAGKPYNGGQIDKRIEALIYMFPEKETDGPVIWWEN